MGVLAGVAGAGLSPFIIVVLGLANVLAEYGFAHGKKRTGAQDDGAMRGMRKNACLLSVLEHFRPRGERRP